MKKYIKAVLVLALVALTTIRCSDDFPIDEDGLLITRRGECAVVNFELLSTDFQPLRSKPVVIDTVGQTINYEVFYGTDLVNVYPQFSLSNDAKLDPKITGKTDFSDLANPKQYTVISGNRKVRKTYTVFISVQKP